MDTDALLSRLAVSLSIGLLIGLERGWRTRNEEDHLRAAGLRTFALTGLTGGITGALARQFDSGLVIGLVFLGFTAAFASYHWLEARAERNYSATSVVAGIATFLLGTLAVVGASFGVESATPLNRRKRYRSHGADRIAAQTGAD